MTRCQLVDQPCQFIVTSQVRKVSEIVFLGQTATVLQFQQKSHKAIENRETNRGNKASVQERHNVNSLQAT